MTHMSRDTLWMVLQIVFVTICARHLVTISPSPDHPFSARYPKIRPGSSGGIAGINDGWRWKYADGGAKALGVKEIIPIARPHARLVDAGRAFSLCAYQQANFPIAGTERGIKCSL
jgi:hypothetical protein